LRRRAQIRTGPKLGKVLTEPPHAQIAARAPFQYRYPMRLLVLACLCLGLSVSPSALSAQEAASQPLEIEPSGQAYLKSLGYRGIDTDVAYFDPTGALPALDTRAEPPAPRKPGDTTTELPSTVRTLGIILAAALLIAVMLLVLNYGGNLTLSLQDDAQNPARARRLRALHPLAETGPPADLQAILATADRRRALIMLVQAALARTIAANNVLLQPSWTMRDALRHIPTGQAHLDALRQLVHAGERVLFGNRDVTEGEFQAHIASIRPLMSGPAR
jgi:hypothetical protein